ncbi:sigma 54-interacting transcriptional regulator [Chondromyces crocatus]|uniref:ATPase AAA n=1 Tax=Chondromyces crocatus TaxID=52 RepID=A0A0K1E8E2_CHOCO|nr:sigma 54-interacting transcriptional regulator [Chondromyces crocatus]AKT37141.1 ATPase AAA [Chondromyces crocatus]
MRLLPSEAVSPEDGIQIPTVRVTATSPLGGKETAALGAAPLAVGSSAECGLTVRDPAVSRRHCEFVLSSRGITLRDLGSKNGTFVGEIRIVEAILPVGATIRIGTTRLSVVMSSPPTFLPLSRSTSFGDAVGQSQVMRSLFARLERASAVGDAVLLTGELGTGKKLLARALHEGGVQRNEAFVAVEISGRPPRHVERDLFGQASSQSHAGTRAEGAMLAGQDGALMRARSGTLLLEDVGDLSPDLQARLLRVLESRRLEPSSDSEGLPFEARVIAATRRNLKAQVDEGTFRSDLYYLLAELEMSVPPLRDRKDDIPMLAERFLAAQTPSRKLSDLPPTALDLLAAHAWPGNVRELQNMVVRLVFLPEEIATAISEEQANPTADDGAAAVVPAGKPSSEPSVDRLLALPLQQARELVLEAFERRYVTAKWRDAGGNAFIAAAKMGISEQLLRQLLERYRLDREG